MTGGGEGRGEEEEEEGGREYKVDFQCNFDGYVSILPTLRGSHNSPTIRDQSNFSQLYRSLVLRVWVPLTSACGTYRF